MGIGPHGLKRTEIQDLARQSSPGIVQSPQQRRHARNAVGLPHVDRGEGASRDKSSHQQPGFVVNDLGRQSQSAGRAVANDLVAAIDAEQRAFLTQSRDVGVTAHPHHEIVIGDSPFDPFDGNRTCAEIQFGDVASQPPIRPLRKRTKPEPADAERVLPVQLELGLAIVRALTPDPGLSIRFQGVIAD